MKRTPTILRIALPVPLRKLFDYLLPTSCNTTQLIPGCRVRVPFQNRELIGIYLEQPENPDISINKLKPIKEIIDSTQLIPDDILELCQWAADYYHYPLGEVLSTALPVFLRQGKPPELQQEQYWRISSQGQSFSPTRAPRQAALMQFLAQHPEGISHKELKKISTKNILTSLLHKNYIESFTKPLALIPSTPTGLRLALNSDQAHAIESIQKAGDIFNVFLLDGVTGSGKTEVYLQTIENFLAQEKQVLVLVPEIGLTPQTLNRFQERFAIPIVALHSGLTEKERLNAWILAKSGEAKIVIGTRSSVFTPLKQLGLIIVDEEHDLSFKQQDTFRYHARDIAVMRAHQANIPIILGSATPSLESLHNVKQGRYQHLRLPQRAGDAQLPQFKILDIRKNHLEEGLSPSLLTQLKKHLEQGNQVMIFLNRRGFAPVLMCHACGELILCKSCDMRMTYHQSPERLHCHHCDRQKPVPLQCEKCGEKALCKIGQGTERLESVLTLHFPHYSIARIDRDNTQQKGSLENLLKKIHNKEHQILIGTQMLAKGHHFPQVTLVAVVDADGGFFSADFRAIERMGQLLLQVSGRAGRAEKTGEVVIQTRQPDHPLLHQLIHKGYQAFAHALLSEREKAKLPPYFFFALFRTEAYDRAHATSFLQQIKQFTDVSGNAPVKIWGPIPAPLAKRAGKHRMQLLLQANNRVTLKTLLKKILLNMEEIPDKHRVHWSLDVDPLEMT